MQKFFHDLPVPAQQILRTAISTQYGRAGTLDDWQLSTIVQLVKPIEPKSDILNHVLDAIKRI